MPIAKLNRAIKTYLIIDIFSEYLIKGSIGGLMKIVKNQIKSSGIRRFQAFTLIEVLISTAIAALSIGGVIYGYTMSAQRAEWSAYSLAAHGLAMKYLEQTRSCKWDDSAEVN